MDTPYFQEQNHNAGGQEAGARREKEMATEAVRVLTLDEQLDFAGERIKLAVRYGDWQSRDFWSQRIKELEDKIRCQKCRMSAATPP